MYFRARRRRTTRSLARPARAESLESRRLLAAGTFAFGASRYEVGEAVGSASFTITRTGGTDGGIHVEYRLGALAELDHATAGEDFTDVAGIVTFARGETSKTVAVPITNDTLAEGNEHVVVTFGALTASATTGAQDETRIYILDDDSPGVLALAEAEFRVPEGAGVATITVTRGGSLQGAVGFNYSLGHGDSWGGHPQGFAEPPGDFDATSGTVSFADGQTTATFTVPVVDDAAREVNERFVVSIGNLTGGATLASIVAASADVRILDNDPVPNEPPDAVNDRATGLTGRPLLIDVLGNDSDPDGGPFQIVVPAPASPNDPLEPLPGTVSVDDGGTPGDLTDDRIRYVPVAGFAGTGYFRYEVRDSLGAAADAFVHVTVSGAGLVPDPEDPTKTALFAQGTERNDRITFQARSGGRVAAVVNGRFQGVFAPTGRVIAAGAEGNDVLRGGAARVPLRADGGPGNDVVVGTRLADVLMGGEGNDRITGGGGRDILFGGRGADRASGGADDDILVAGFSVFDDHYALGASLPADLLQIWASDAPYATRSNDVQWSHGGSGGPLGPSQAGMDAEADVLLGQAGTDLFLANADGLGSFPGAVDRIIARAADETIVEQ